MSKALIPLAPGRSRAADPPANRPSADFVAQLIATTSQAPQTRARRRAEPQDAAAAYHALGQWPIPAGRVLSRAL